MFDDENENNVFHFHANAENKRLNLIPWHL